MPGGRRLHSALQAVAAVAVLVASGIFAGAIPPNVSAATPADVLDVVRVGTGTSALTNAATAVSIVPLLGVGTGMGTLGTPIPLPTSGSGANVPFALSGSATSEGALSLSANGQFLTLAGYDATPGTTGPGGGSIANSLTTSVPRVVARVSGAGVVDTSTVLNAFSGNNPRGAISDDGTRFWATGAGSSGNPRGIVYAPLGNAFATAVTAVGSNVTNARAGVIAGGNLFLSTNNNNPPGLYQVGSGLPTTPQAATAVVALAGNDPYGFVFTDSTTLYVADGGIKKYSLIAGAWTAEGSASAGTQLTGLAGRTYGGLVQLYATSLDGSKIFAFADSAASNATISGSFTKFEDAPANTAYKGIAFAPSGQVPPAPASTIGLSDTSLGGVIGDPNNPTLIASLASDTVPADQIQLSASSSSQAVAPDAGISISGSGSERTIAVTPGGTVGYATITLTAAAPGAPDTTTQFLYGASAAAPDTTSHFLAGASDASTAIDVGGGFIVVGDDESNVLRLYDTAHSGGPVKTWDFTTTIGASSIDIEAAARLGNTIYWTGSMGNNSDGSVKPARSTLFATTLTGSGASTELTLDGVYKNLRNDLIALDQANGDRFGFAAGAAEGQIPKEINGFNVEGLEIAPDGTGYLGFRAPLLPQTDRHLALVVPVSNLVGLVTVGGPASFGSPMLWDLGGLSVRELRRNADGQYLVIGGSYQEGGDEHLYSWDGDPADQPVALGPTLPAFLTGAWEALPAVPDPLTNGAPVQLLMDTGDWNYYGDDPPVEAKTLSLGLRKALIDTVSITLAPQVITFTSTPASPAYAGTTYSVTATGGGSGNPVIFSIDGASTPGACTIAGSLVSLQVAGSCVIDADQAGTFQYTAGHASQSVTVSYRQLTALANPTVWVGLKNSDDVGVKFDLRAEVYVNGSLVTSGQAASVVAGSSGFPSAKLDTISLAPFAPVAVPPGSTLSLKLLVRTACTGSGHNSGTARLWYNDGAANSGFGATISPSARNEYLAAAGALSAAPGSGPRLSVDVNAGPKCGSFQSFGAWSAAVP